MKRNCDRLHDGSEIIVVIALLVLIYGFAAFFHLVPWWA